ncbi:MAG TPA: 3-dehydroquinate synthase [Beijerinckiaceae bacterium]
MLERSRHATWGETHLQRFAVAYELPVVFTRDVFDPANPTLADALRRREPEKRHRLALFVDTGVIAAMPNLERMIRRYAAAHAGSLAIEGAIVAVPSGEEAKTDPQLVERLLGELANRAIDRHSYAVAIGGGAVLDAVGYAAAIFHRGVRHVRLPTTVLAQADSGVGVKNAVNAFGVKNLVGTFAPPFAIVNDGTFVDHLPAREKRSGLSEAVKVALIRDRAFFEWIEANADALAGFHPNTLDRLIERSARLHMRQIAQGGDPFETGSARPLDYGHWSAHRLESLTGHKVSHGEAVAIGVALDTRYAVLAGLLPAGEDERVRRLLEKLGFTLWCDALALRDAEGQLAVLRGLKEFQEHLGGELTVTLIDAVGHGVEVNRMDHRLIEEAIGWLAGARG